MISSVWKDLGAPSPHKTIKSFENAELHKAQGTPPSPSDLTPGDTFAFNKSDFAPTVSHTDDEKITFANGGSIEDKPGEGGLLLTKPDGESLSLDKNYGFVHYDDDPDSPTANQPAVFFKSQDNSGDWVLWKQTFPSDGGTVIQMAENDVDGFSKTFGVSSNGEASAKLEDYDFFGSKYAAKVDGPAVVAEMEGGSIGISPPVPLEWLVSQ